MGEAPARSSLVPRDLTAELCLIALASLGAFTNVSTLYSLFESNRSYLMLLASLGILLLGICLAAFGLVVVRRRSVPCLSQLCLV